IPFAFSSDPGALSHRFCGESLLKKAGGGLARLFGSRKLGGRRENLFAYGYAMAGEAGLALAAVIAQVARLWGAEGLSIDIIAHSLGARVVTSALRRLAREHETERGITYVDQVIFLAAALSRHQVSALGRETWLLSKGGRRAPTFQIFNFTSQSDKLLRFVGAPLADRVGQRLERGLLPPSSALRLVLMNLPRVKVPVVGVHGGGTASDWLNWIDIPLDHPQTQEWAEIAGLDLAGELRECALDHWVHYTHRGNWTLYNRILTDKSDWTIDAILTGRSSGSSRVLRPPLTARSDELYEVVKSG
ncbi:MAG: alpha/beta hydrolase, partial [Pseudomonadota bacterium]